MKCVFCKQELIVSEEYANAWCQYCIKNDIDEETFEGDKSNYLVYLTTKLSPVFGQPYEVAIRFQDDLYLNAAWTIPLAARERVGPIVVIKAGALGETLVRFKRDMRWIIDSSAEEIRNKINIWLTFL